jgi:hypothetical protein
MALWIILNQFKQIHEVHGWLATIIWVANVGARPSWGKPMG